MRITVVTSSYPRFPGDVAAPFVQSISESLVKVGHDVEVVAPYDVFVFPSSRSTLPIHRFRYALLDKWHIMGHSRALVNDMQFKMGVFVLSPFFFLSEFFTILRVARDQHADLIYAHWVLPNGFVAALAARILNIPLLISLHGSDIFVAKKYRLLRWLASWTFQQAKVITACSKALQDGAVELNAPSHVIHLLAWGADPERFSPAVLPLPRVEFGLSEADIVIISLGRIVPKKGFHVLIRALPLLLKVHPSIQVVIGGEGDQRESLLSLAKELGVLEHLHFPGKILWESVPSFLKMGDVFVLPSIQDSVGNLDGLPTVLLEALGVGLPVVASDIAGVPLVIENGDNGILCPPGDIAALSNAILEVLKTPSFKDKMGKAAAESVKNRFNWVKVADKITSLLDSRENLI